MTRLLFLVLILLGCGIFRGSRNGSLDMKVESKYSCYYEDDFTIVRLSTGKVIYQHGATYYPKYNFRDTVIVQHEMGIPDTVFVELKHRYDYVEVGLKPNERFLDSIAKKGKEIEERIARITNCDSLSSERESAVDESINEPVSYPGGMEAMYKDLTQHINYPKSAYGEGISGKVFLKFMIDQHGLIKCARVVRGIPDCEECDTEALLGLSYLKMFTPARLDGVPVITYYNLPINFDLE